MAKEHGCDGEDSRMAEALLEQGPSRCHVLLLLLPGLDGSYRVREGMGRNGPVSGQVKGKKRWDST